MECTIISLLSWHQWWWHLLPGPPWFSCQPVWRCSLVSHHAVPPLLLSACRELISHPSAMVFGPLPIYPTVRKDINCDLNTFDHFKRLLLLYLSKWGLFPTLLWQEASQGSICLIGEPIAISTILMALTSSASSAGSSDAAWSLPFQVLSRVTWRSRTFAPSATAATDTWMPVSCPEYPMGMSGNSFWNSCNRKWEIERFQTTH